VTSVIRYFDSAPEFTMAAPTFSQPVMAVLASLGQSDGGWLKFLGPVLWPFMGLLVPWAMRRGLLIPDYQYRSNSGPFTLLCCAGLWRQWHHIFHACCTTLFRLNWRTARSGRGAVRLSIVILAPWLSPTAEIVT
jgi:hypothetical protein